MTSVKLIGKNTDVLRVQLKSVGGKMCLDIRRCLSTPSGELVPTSRGFSLSSELIAELIEKMISANGRPQFIDL